MAMLPEELSEDGTDISLLTSRELQLFETYVKLRQYFATKYPKTQDREDEYDDIDILRARDDAKATLFLDLMVKMQTLFHKIDTLQALCTDYEKNCIRLYSSVIQNWDSNTGSEPLSKLLHKDEIYEVVEAYYKIMRKYHQPTFEEPYYWLAPKLKRAIIYEGEMLKRTAMMEDGEIRVSLLEALE